MQKVKQMEGPDIVKPGGKKKSLFSQMSFVKLAKADAGRKTCVLCAGQQCLCLPALFSTWACIGVPSLSHQNEKTCSAPSQLLT